MYDQVIPAVQDLLRRIPERSESEGEHMQMRNVSHSLSSSWKSARLSYAKTNKLAIAPVAHITVLCVKRSCVGLCPLSLPVRHGFG